MKHTISRIAFGKFYSDMVSVKWLIHVCLILYSICCKWLNCYFVPFTLYYFDTVSYLILYFISVFCTPHTVLCFDVYTFILFTLSRMYSDECYQCTCNLQTNGKAAFCGIYPIIFWQTQWLLKQGVSNSKGMIEYPIIIAGVTQKI